MVNSDDIPTEPKEIASLTFAYLRRIENQQTKMMEVLLRHETRLGRLERDLGESRRDLHEVKSDIVLFENRLLTQLNEMSAILHRLDDHQRRLEKLQPGQ
jgi:hypothetical protein